MAPQEIGVALGNPPASEQAKSDHQDFLCNSFLSGQASLCDGPRQGYAARYRPAPYIQKSREKSRRLPCPEGNDGGACGPARRRDRGGKSPFASRFAML